MTSTAGDQPADGQVTCIECGAATAARYCSNCGAEARPARLGFQSIVSTSIEHFLSLDLPLLRTFLDLWRFPGGVAGDYVLGRRRRYTNPLKYNLITAPVIVAVIHLILESATPAATAPAAGAARADRIIAEATRLAARWQNLYIQVLYVATLPLLAYFLQSLLGRRSGRNTMEFYVLCLYAWGQTYLFQAAGNLMSLWLKGTTGATVFGLASAIMPFVYFPWATVGFCRSGVVTPAIVGLLCLLVFSFIIGMAFVAAAAVWVVARGIA